MGRRAPLLVRAWLALALLGACAAGCKTGPNLSADYGATARENYELAIGEFADRDYEEAIAYADFVRIRFPFSRFAVEAELIIARSRFELGEHIVAADAFKEFTRLHPTHKHTRNGWAPYMVAVSAYMASPESFWPLPPHYQRDQTLLREALEELEHFFDHHGHTQMAPLAKELEGVVKRKLLEHELYVANFYLDRDRPEAAISRLEDAHARYPGIGRDAEVLFLLGVTYLRVDEIELARNTFAELQLQHPGHHHGKQARLYLDYITDNFGAADPQRMRPERPRPRPVTPPRPKPPKKKKRKRDKNADPAQTPAATSTPTG